MNAPTKPGEVLFLDRNDVYNLLAPEECLERVEETFRWVGEGEVEQVDPVNFWLDHEQYGFGAIQAFPAHVKPLGVAGNKWLSACLGNAERDLPTFTGINVLTDTESAMPLAILEGQSITALRTAGHAGIGAKYLAPEDADSVAIIGCGDQGRTHLRVMNDLFNLHEIRVCDSVDNTTAFIEEMSDVVEPDITATTDAREAVEGADIVCTVTSSEAVVVEESWIEPGTHVAATAGFKDLDPSYSAQADLWAVGWSGRDLTWIEGEEAGKFGPEELSANDVDTDLIEVINGEHSGRTRPDQRTVMTHMGMPALDTAASHLIFERALEAGAGKTLELFEHP